jgi:hypothetical protein
MTAIKKQRNMHYPVIACHLAYYAHMINDSTASEFPFLIYNLTFLQECYQVTFAWHFLDTSHGEGGSLSNEQKRQLPKLANMQ